MTFDEIVETFEFLDDWEDRYKYLIELGRALPLLADAHKTPENKVHGCVSQVWVHHEIDQDKNGASIFRFSGDSDAFIVKGLVAVVFAIFNERRPDEIKEIDAHALLNSIGLSEHLTPQRSNGLKALVERIKNLAAAY